MKVSYSTALLVAFALTSLDSCLAQTKRGTPAAPPLTYPGPKIAFGSTVYDFGKIEAGDVVTNAFVFTNIGTATIEILDVKPGCGCTTAGTWTRKVKPGKTGIIPLQFDSANFGGPVEKQATVMCNDPGQSNLVLEIKGIVWKPIDVSSSMVAFNVSSESQPNETKVVRIVSNRDEPLTLSDMECTNQSFHAELKTVRQGKEFELRISTVAPLASNSMASLVALKTSSAKVPKIEIMIYLVVQQPVTVIPPQLLLPAAPFSNVVHQVITIRYIGTNSMVLAEPVVNVAGVSVKMKETESGRSYNLDLDFPGGFEVQPGQNVEVSVKSNHPKFPRITVPVYQIQNSATR
jgi:hypothetical protein